MAEAIEEAIENLEKITDETPISPENPGTPQQPTEPDREEENLPSQSGNSENANENKPPHTSDATLMGLYYAILSVSACALLGAIYLRKKKDSHKNRLFGISLLYIVSPLRQISQRGEIF